MGSRSGHPKNDARMSGLTSLSGHQTFSEVGMELHKVEGVRVRLVVGLPLDSWGNTLIVGIAAYAAILWGFTR
jgi:hypothetical protein